MGLVDLAEFAAQLALVSGLVYVSSVAPGPGSQRPRQGRAPQQQGASESIEESSEGGTDPALVENARWVIKVALMRHVATICGVLWHITTTPSPPAVSFGLLLLAFLLLLHGVATLLVSMAGFERHAAELYPTVAASLHPLSLVTVLLPHMLPGAPGTGAAALLINHAVLWLLAPVGARGKSLRTVMLCEAAAAVFVCCWGALHSAHTSALALLVEIAWQAALIAWGGIVLPFACLFALQSAAAGGAEDPAAAPEAAPPQLLPQGLVMAFTAASALLEAAQHVPRAPPLCAATRGLLGCGQPAATPLHQPALLHASLLLLVTVMVVALRRGLAALGSAEPSLKSNGGGAPRSRLAALHEVYSRLSHAQQSAATTFCLILVIQLFSYYSIYGHESLSSNMQGALMGALFCAGVGVQLSCAWTLSEGDAAGAPVLEREPSGAPSGALDSSSPWVQLCVTVLFAEVVPDAASDRVQSPKKTARSNSGHSSVGSGVRRAQSLHVHLPSGSMDGPPSPETPAAPLYQRSADAIPFEQRAAALSSFKQFMSISDANYSAFDMLRGAAASVEAVFPGVRHVGVFLLCDAMHTNNFTIIGDGTLWRPRRAVPMAKGTLVQHVVRKSHPVYIEDVATFAVKRTFQDVQFMRYIMQIKSVACVPVVSIGSVCFGCVLLGFTGTRAWDMHDKQLCTRLAAIVAQYHAIFEALDDSDSEPDAARVGSRATSEKLLPVGDRAENARRISSLGASDTRLKRPRSTASRATIETGAHPASRSLLGTPSHRSDTSPVSEAALTRSYCDDELGTSGDEDTAVLDPALADFGSQGSSREVPELGGRDPQELLASTASTSDGELRILELIGAGGFGNVYRALWQRQIVAVKVMEHGEEALGFHVRRGAVNADSDQDDNCRKALFEGAMSSAISHPNVVTTYDYLVKKMDQGGGSTRRILQETQLIMEYCDRGSLSDVIEQGTFHRSGDGQIDMEALLVTLLEVAHAVEYLHSLQITHRDLKPKNILLKSSNKDRRGFTAKVSDFGLSQVLSDKSKPHITSKYSGTITHMPPELIENGLVFAAGDVYAFGIIMWECYTRLSPYKGLVHPQIMMGVVSSCLRPAFPSTCPPGYRVLAERCWQQRPEARPTFLEVAKGIRALLHAFT